MVSVSVKAESIYIINTQSLVVVGNVLEICTYFTATFYAGRILIDATMLCPTFRKVYIYVHMHKYLFSGIY